MSALSPAQMLDTTARAPIGLSIPFFTGGTGDNLLGTCGGASHGPGHRSALANWATRISQLTP